jgi:hypothetical protein
MSNVNVNEMARTQTATTSTACPSVGERLGGVAMGLVLGSGSLVSLWSVATLAGAFATNGTAALVRGFVTAVTGV